MPPTPAITPRQAYAPEIAQARETDFFVHTIEVLPLTANAVGQTASVQISDDGGFLITGISAIVTLVDNTTNQAFWPITIELLDSASGRYFGDKPIHLQNLAGSAQLPYNLTRPKPISRATAISARLNNLSATAFNVRLSLHGIKLYGR